QEHFGKKILRFVDFDEQRYQLISDEDNSGVPADVPWQAGAVPLHCAITGLVPMVVRVDIYKTCKEIVGKLYIFEAVATEDHFYLFGVREGGNGAQVIVEHKTEMPQAMQGFGTVHHAAFRAADSDVLQDWINWLGQIGLPNSGYVNRHYFESLYTKASPHILFEIATDGPGFMGDEPYETLGEILSLPPALQSRREEIEGYVRHIDTVRSNKTFTKEYE